MADTVRTSAEHPEAFTAADPAAQARQLAELPVLEAARQARRAPLHELARAVRHLDRATFRDLERRLPGERRRALRHLLSLPPGCVGATQRDDYTPVNDGVPAEAALRALEGQSGADPSVAYVVHGDGRYCGVVAPGQLLGQGRTPVGRLVTPRAALSELDDRHRALRCMDRARLDELPVVDTTERLVGVARRADLAPQRRSWAQMLPRLGGRGAGAERRR
ncbi:CBS domain-containing protein [Halorhodospira neutriphila]|uniref:CBS domain-containing protein n=1 Tax=Halorhodospira neutriphila TaxID=168379 RepID=A0ABS1E4F3_9GAMM|nr:CBS domain-containing protein [Halorhodospira neutriphila]MBK1726616.1 hypothetical protein [Halorhodospira neutriphila]